MMSSGTRIPGPLGRTRIGMRDFVWGERTFVMGIVNVTPDSFSGDGLLALGHAGRQGAASDREGNEPGLEPAAATAVEQARSMAADGADLLDVGGESTRPGHAEVPEDEERRRVVPVIAAVHAALPDLPISVDTTKAAVAAAALDAGASLVNTIWGVDRPGARLIDDPLIRLVAERGAPIILMHNRAEARYTNLVAEIVADLEHSIETALSIGITRESVIVDPGFGFGKTAVDNLALLADLAALRVLGRPILLGTSRKSTLGKVLDLPAEERLEATLATTALGIAAGIDIVRVHDVRANVRTARMADAVVRAPVITGVITPVIAPDGPAGRPS